jgi:hypothetical protein
MSIREFFRWLWRGIRHRCYFCNEPAEFLIDELPMCRKCAVKFLRSTEI